MLTHLFDNKNYLQGISPRGRDENAGSIEISTCFHETSTQSDPSAQNKVHGFCSPQCFPTQPISSNTLRKVLNIHHTARSQSSILLILLTPKSLKRKRLTIFLTKET
ncbi:hypothetical protein NPIL_636891 [Nephila pilipes]|uniref:Uncharacterized protein n=1 Tax=Nephila pilipes TaxID=299642 RepID=A0A8X6R4Z7_NEPPI|nr:hypothetical protein NPIL_636891 [Nephila pilipes]